MRDLTMRGTRIAGYAGYCLLLAPLLMRPALSAESPAPTLSYFQHGGAGVQWMFWHADHASPVLFLETPSPPKHVFWDVRENTVYYAVGSEIFRAPVSQVPAQARRVATLPANGGEVRALWRERGSGRFRVITMHAVEENNVVTKKGLRYRLPDGSTIRGMTVPPWGLPFICSVQELGDDGRSWKMLARRATKDMAGETPGIAVVDDLRHERGVTNDNLLDSYTCGAGQCRDDVPPQLIKLIADQTGIRFDAAEAAVLADKSGRSAVVFGLVMGDQLHMASPAVLVNTENRVARLIKLDDQKQLGIGINRGRLLVEQETTGVNPVVIDMKTGTVQFRAQGWNATWMPEK